MAAGTLYGGEQRMAIRWPYKLIQRPKENRLALFDLQRDPEEKEDLIQTHQEIAETLAAELDLRMEDISSGAQSEGVELDAEMLKHLRELGYLK